MGPPDPSTAAAPRPGILLLGPPNSGKRTLLSRLLPAPPSASSSSHPWTIDTKYYTADVTVHTAHLTEGERAERSYDDISALVLVFDLSKTESFQLVRNFVENNKSVIELDKFDVALCVGNKVDLVEGHAAHVEYRRRVGRRNEALGFDEWVQFGEGEGRGLLDEEGSAAEVEVREWCVENGVEYVEACAANEAFDRCLSVDGDVQGVERVAGALAACMWRGMVLKGAGAGGGRRVVVEPYLPEGESESEGESEGFEFEYEVLSDGLGEKWEVMDEEWVSASGVGSTVNGEVGETSNGCRDGGSGGSGERDGALEISGVVREERSGEEVEEVHDSEKEEEEEKDCGKEEGKDLGAPFEFEDLEHLMSEIGGMRDSLRMMPDFQRREMAAKLAMRMAAMFGGESEDED